MPIPWSTFRQGTTSPSKLTARVIQGQLRAGSMGIRLSVRARTAHAHTDDAAFEFDQDRIRVGRAMGSDVLLPDPTVSQRHATIERRGDRYVVLDHDSTNGCRVNGQALVPERPKALRSGDTIIIGAFALVYRDGVPVSVSNAQERTLSIARRLLSDVRGDRDGGLRIRWLNGPDQGRSLSLPEPPARLLVGRAESADVVLQDADASREHVELVIDVDGVEARDLSSKNGFFVNERKVDRRRLLDRDELLIGATLLLFEDQRIDELRSMEARPDVPFSDPIEQPAEPTAVADPSREEIDAPTGEPPLRQSEVPTDTHRIVTPTRSSSSAEAVVYFLAALVLFASLIGLYLLFQAH